MIANLPRLLILILCASPLSTYAQGNFLESLASEVLKGAKGSSSEAVTALPSLPPTDESTSTSISVPSASNNLEPQKQFPCLSKICLNDLILSHQQTVQWVDASERLRDAMYEPAYDKVVTLGPKNKSKTNNQMPKEEREERDDPTITFSRNWIKKYVSGLSEQDKEKLLPYIVLKTADKGLFQLLSDKKPIFCRNFVFTAFFFSESGYETLVRFGPNAKGEFRIIEIQRFFKGDHLELKKVEDGVYKQFPYLNNSTPKSPWGGYASYSMARTTRPILMFQVGNWKDYQSEVLSQQSSCGQPKGAID